MVEMSRETEMSAHEEFLDNLRIIRGMLPKGYTKKIAEEMGVSAMTVTNAMWGRTRRFDIIDRAVEMADEYNKTRKKLNEVANS